MRERPRQLSDEELKALLEDARRRRSAGSPQVSGDPRSSRSTSGSDIGRNWDSVRVMRPSNPSQSTFPHGGVGPVARPNDLQGHHGMVTDSPLQTSHNSFGDNKISLRGVTKELWSERGKTYKAIAGLAATATGAVVFAGGVNALTGKSVLALTGEATGVVQTNKLTFDAPLDCQAEPVITADVEQHTEYILNYKGVIANKDELAKSKADKAYKPQRLDSFDDIVGAAKAQSTSKPAPIEPFFTDKPTDRLPQTIMSGKMVLGICNIESMSEALVVKGNKVEIDGSKFAMTYDQKNTINKKAIVAYEKFAPKALGKNNPGYITDAEYTRVRAIVVPNENDPAVNSVKMDSLIKASTLKGLASAGCREVIQPASKKYIESYLQSKYPDIELTFTWKSGAINSPYDVYTKNNAVEPDVKLSNPDDIVTSCEDVTFDGVDMEKKK